MQAKQCKLGRADERVDRKGQANKRERERGDIGRERERAGQASEAAAVLGLFLGGRRRFVAAIRLDADCFSDQPDDVSIRFRLGASRRSWSRPDFWSQSVYRGVYDGERKEKKIKDPLNTASMSALL